MDLARGTPGTARHAGQLQYRGRSNNGASLSELAPELIEHILAQLVPVGPIITYESTAAEPVSCPNQIECRSALSNLSRASRLFYRLAVGYLYRNVLLQDRKELFCFFRILVNRPALRQAVRSFAWASVLSDDEPLPRTYKDAVYSIGSEDCDSVRWPSTDEELLVTRRMGIEDSGGALQSWRVLGAILAMIPRAKTLFIIFSSIRQQRMPPRCPEWDALRTLIDMEGSGPDTYGSSHGLIMAPTSRRFLQELTSITIETNPAEHPSYSGSAIHQLLANCPLLRKIQVNGMAALYKSANSTAQLPLFCSAKMQQVLYFSCMIPWIEIPVISAAFPRLILLETECVGGQAPWTDTNISELSKALLALSETLETLSLTTVLGSYLGSLDVRPILTSLKHMKLLKSLTTEFIWLCGSEQFPSLALNMTDLLPPSLVYLRVVDSWYVPKADSWHGLPRDWISVPFLDQILSNFHARCVESFPTLRYFTLEFPCFSDNNAMILEHGGLQDLIVKFRTMFEDIGVSFQCRRPQNRVERSRS